MEASIFRLNVDCFEEIFDYLSLKELHSFGQTCKTMQQIAGKYFQRHFKSAEKFSGNDGIYTMYSNHEDVINQRIQTTHFNQFINYISHYYEEFESLRYIQLHCDEFISINHIYLVCLEIDATKVQFLQKILKKTEVVQLRQCTMSGDFYENFLKNCCKLKRLYIQDDLGDIIDEYGNAWLLRQYPSLEFFQLTLRYPFKIPELATFFERNPTIRYFSTSSRCLWVNRHELLESKVNVDRLEIQILDNFYRQLIDVRLICELLNQLFVRGFYQRLYLFVKRVDQKTSDLLTTLGGLEHLSMRQFSGNYSLSHLVNLKELAIFDGAHNMDALANGLVNLERLLIQNVKHSDILPFIRRSMKLNKIKLNLKNELDEKTLDLATLNQTRQLLNGARKITIYVPCNIFLATKWTTTNGNINLDYIEMKRNDSYEWEQHFCTINTENSQ